MTVASYFVHFRTFHIDILLYLLGLDEGPGPLKEPVRLLCDARLLSEPLWYDCKLLMEPLRKSNTDMYWKRRNLLMGSFISNMRY